MSPKIKVILLLVIAGLVLYAISVPAQTLTLFGKQTKRGQLYSTKLESEPTELSQTATITEVKGGRSGFWINKKTGQYSSKTVYEFWKVKDAIGKMLEPGAYVVYPMLPQGEEEETVTVYLGSNTETAKKPPVKIKTASSQKGNSAQKQYFYVMENYYEKLSGSGGGEKERLAKEAIEGFQEVVDNYKDPYAKTTQMLALYYQAQCYKELGEEENYRTKLMEALAYINDYQGMDESALAFTGSLSGRITVELKGLTERR